MIYLNTFLASFLIALVLTFVVREVALRIKIVDIPNYRSLHHVPVPKTGGIAIYFAFVLPLIWVLGRGYPHMFSIIVGATIILLVGFLDDVNGISPTTKIAGQVLAALVLIGSGIKIGFFPDIVSVPLTIFWLVGITNALNLLDGMDGLAAGVSAIIALFFMILALRSGEPQIALLSVALAGACLGFVRFNFHKAIIFMGDTGSLFLGFVLGSLGVMNSAPSSNFLHLSVPVILLGLPIFDTSLAVMRRIWKRKPLFEADCDHFYEWLWKKRIFKYKTVVFMTYFICVMLGIGVLAIW